MLQYFFSSGEEFLDDCGCGVVGQWGDLQSHICIIDLRLCWVKVRWDFDNKNNNNYNKTKVESDWFVGGCFGGSCVCTCTLHWLSLYDTFHTWKFFLSNEIIRVCFAKILDKVNNSNICGEKLYWKAFRIFSEAKMSWNFGLFSRENCPRWKNSVNSWFRQL